MSEPVTADVTTPILAASEAAASGLLPSWDEARAFYRTLDRQEGR